ncbi:MAG: hypothetical protein O9328_14450 [Rhodobacteraceae bacterium]|nr:hypothetical protein [Paracoccaceae bacterium]
MNAASGRERQLRADLVVLRVHKVSRATQRLTVRYGREAVIRGYTA